MNLEEFARQYQEHGWHILNDKHEVVAVPMKIAMQWLADDEEQMRLGRQSKCTVAQTMIGEVRVSTVFLRGVPHIGPGGGEHFFETMIFGGPLDQQQWRYKTWEVAELGHKNVCELVREELAKAGEERSFAE